MTKAELIQVAYSAFPYPNQINGLDIDSENKAIRFFWRGNEFRVNDGLFVEQVQGSMLVGTDLAILVEALMKREYFKGLADATIAERQKQK